jgi:hypothetical protein
MTVTLPTGTTSFSFTDYHTTFEVNSTLMMTGLWSLSAKVPILGSIADYK